MHDRGIQLLRNKTIAIEHGKSRIWIAGIDDALVSAADLDQALRDIPAPETTVLLAHEPDVADYVARFPG